jgi:hypothetical protein
VLDMPREVATEHLPIPIHHRRVIHQVPPVADFIVLAWRFWQIMSFVQFPQLFRRDALKESPDGARLPRCNRLRRTRRIGPMPVYVNPAPSRKLRHRKALVQQAGDEMA